MSDKIMEMLKADEKANKMIKLFHETAVKQGLKDEEYQEARKTMLMLIMANNKEVMAEMAKEVWEHHNK
jgi:hypothetical protein